MKHKKGDSMNTLMLRLLVVVSVMGCFIVGNAWAWEMVAIDINTATAEDLATLPGLSATVAQNIVSFRNANGPFSAVDDLLKVEGMDQDKLNRIRDMVVIGEGSAPTQLPDVTSE
jgi:competence ComEA-like helix-hairpin-helix protein